MTKEQLDKEAEELYPLRTSDNETFKNIANARKLSQREAYKAGRLKTLEEKDKELETFKDAYVERNDKCNELAQQYEEKERRIKELEEEIRKLKNIE